MLGRYCGNRMPPNITSTHNKLYLWFRTDQSHSHGGFALTWNSVDPGTDLRISYSPAYFIPNWKTATNRKIIVTEFPIGLSVSNICDLTVLRNIKKCNEW